MNPIFGVWGDRWISTWEQVVIGQGADLDLQVLKTFMDMDY